MAETFGQGNVPWWTNPPRILLAKILNVVGSGGGGGGSGSPGATGIGSPEGVVTANPGTLYLDTLADSVWIKQSGTGNIGWLQVIG